MFKKVNMLKLCVMLTYCNSIVESALCLYTLVIELVIRLSSVYLSSDYRPVYCDWNVRDLKYEHQKSNLNTA